MRLVRMLAARALKLPKATHKLFIDRDLPMVTSDGVTLFAHRYHYGSAEPAPVVLMRSPYGRAGQKELEARMLAERGYQTVVQSCRGTFGSGGDFEPFRNEKRDGAEAVAWVKQQPWCDGRVMTYGASYVGMTQWAALAGGAQGISAMAVQVASTRPSESVIYPGGAFALESMATWVGHLGLDARRVLLRATLGRRGLSAFRARVAATPALCDTDVVASGRTVPYYQEWLKHPDTSDAWWEPSDFSPGLSNTPELITILGGWYDFFLAGQIEDVVELQRRGLRPRLRVGPWDHGGGVRYRLADALRVFHVASGDKGAGALPENDQPVQMRLCRDTEWLGFEAWPPPSTPQIWHLRAGGGLTADPPGNDAPDSYTYDPRHPTPSLGGTQLGTGAGPKDQAEREKRADVLTFASSPFTKTTRFAGDLSATIHIQTSTAHSDLFVRLCHVDKKGVSTNIADGLVRMRPENGLGVAGAVRAVEVPMFPVGLLVRAGERLRVQISSCAHPAFSRNWGGGEDSATACDGPRCDVRILHDAEHQSAITLPVIA